METTNLNKEEIQSLVDNFITDNANQIEKISQENPLLFDSVTNILSFISTKLGTREGGIELPKFEPKEEVVLTNVEVKESGLKMGICYIQNNNINSYKIGFYQVESIDKNGKDLLLYNKNNLNNSFNISFNDFQKLLKNGDVAYVQNLNFDTLYEKEFQDGAKIIFELSTTPLMNHIQINYDEEFTIQDSDNNKSYRLSKAKAFDIEASSEISVEILGNKRVLTTYAYKQSILESLSFQVGQGFIKVIENAKSTASNVSWDKENILCYVKQDLFGLQNGFYSLSYSESRNETKFVDNLGIQKNPNMSYSELERLKQLGDIIVYDNIRLNDGNNVYYFEENKNILLKIKLSTNNGMVLIYLLDGLNKPLPQPYIFTINYNYDGDVEAGSFVVYKNSGKENFLKTISRRISEKEIVLVPESSPIVQTLFPQPQQTTTTATTTTTAKKGKKALSQDQKDRIAEIKLEIEGLELIADDDDDAKAEIEKLKNEIKQIKNS
jgi:hypothetical protein